MSRQRADLALVERGFFDSRAKAQEAIAAGTVSIDGRVLRKPSAPIGAEARIEAAPPYPWVSRGGVKLEAALDAFGFDPAGAICLDVGASTGGFTQVLLAHGARLSMRSMSAPASCIRACMGSRASCHSNRPTFARSNRRGSRSRRIL
jgi:23S rRNA (cytidine1920-2'-O)/16S rRNA (cytidine1409-2'-O)-methyltransferase